MITELQQPESISVPTLPRSGASSPANSGASALLEPDGRELDQFVEGCLAQLRQVMDELR